MRYHDQIKHNVFLILILLAAGIISAQTPQQLADEQELQQIYPGYRGVSPDYLHAGKEAIENFRDLKYGMRIHWGIYSLWEIEASWDVRNKFDNAKRAEYYQLVNKFNPKAFDPNEWMELFKELGFKFFTITTKHHDGFSMFDTKTKVKKCWDWNAPGGPKIIDCDKSFSIMDTPYKKDIIRQLTTAANKHGIKIDLYYSHPDWFDADQRFDLWHPLKGTPICDNYTKESDPVSYARFMKRHRQQITELLTNYGKIDMMCLDMKFPDWAFQDLVDDAKVARKLQPSVMLRRRGINEYGDYTTPERWYPESPEDHRVTVPWLAIDPVGGPFAYEPDGSKYRDDKWMLTTLIKVVSTGGNFSPAIGPDATGKFHPTVIEYLRIVGNWLKVNGEAVYKTRPWYWFCQGESIRFTRSKDYEFVYAHLLQWPGNTLTLNGIKPKHGAAITLLADPDKTAINWNFSGGKLILDGLGAIPTHGEHAWVLKIPVDKSVFSNWISRDATYEVSSNNDPNLPKPELLNGQVYKEQYAFQTNKEKRPYIIIDLAAQKKISALVINNRKTENQDRAKTLTVWLSDDKANWQQVWQTDLPLSQMVCVLPRDKSARYIKVGLQDTDYLHLSYVKIYGN